MNIIKLDKILFILLLVTIGLLFGQKSILSNVITISPQSHQMFKLYNDEMSGGKTTTKLLSTKHTYKWQCLLIKDSTPYPYCGFEINLGTSISKGVDLTDYEYLKIWLNYQGEADTVRLTLRNFNPAYSTTRDKVSTKFHQLDIPKSHLPDGKQILLRSFSVPTWWKLTQNIPINLDGPELSNTVLIDVQTGSELTAGLHQFELSKIEIHGQWLATENWYFSILFTWILIGGCILIIRLTKLKKAIVQGSLREQELIELNNVLDHRAKELLEISKKDKLTGALNRQGIENAVSQGMLEWTKQAKPLSIIMLDIDHFKKINDTHGHDVGDNVLMSLTKLVKKNIRSTDSFARWGGEEFVLVCRNTPIETASLIAENLRDRIARTALIDDIKVTASFGISDIENCGSIQKLFKQADEALYLAKNSGRNKVELKRVS